MSERPKKVDPNFRIDSKLSDQTQNAIETVIQDLQKNWRVEHPTRSELLLTLFIVNGGSVSIEELSRLFEDNSDPDRATRNLISYLKPKLQEHGFTFESVTYYQIVALNPEENNDDPDRSLD